MEENEGSKTKATNCNNKQIVFKTIVTACNQMTDNA